MIKVFSTPSDTARKSLTKVTQDAKNLFKSNNRPYSLKDGVEGPETVVVFDKHFIMVMRDADSNECMAKMSKLEKYVYWDYLNYQSIKFNVALANPGYTEEEILNEAASIYRSTREYKTPEVVVEALDLYSAGEVLQLDKDNCYDSIHLWD